MELLISHTFEKIRLISEANNFDHWTVKRKRMLEIAWQLNDFFYGLKRIELPCVVKITRISPRQLDSDNMQMAVKHVRDCLANWLIPGKRPGRADDSKQIFWQYEQEKGTPRQHALRIEIYGNI